MDLNQEFQPEPDKCYNESQYEAFLDKVLAKEEYNNVALYGKALVYYQQGMVEESAQTLNKAMEDESLFRVNSKAEELKVKLIELLEPKPPTEVYILEELKNKYEDLKHHESFLLNFMTFPKPKVPSVPRPQSSYASREFGAITIKSFRTVQSTRAKNCWCAICNKSFSKMFSLHRHMQLHTGIKSHACSICKRTFIQKSDMQRHEASHSTELNVPCTFGDCQKRFKTTKNMRNHLITHSIERPFKCSVCSRTFKVKRLLRFHEGLHKDVKDFNCDICGKGFPAKPYLKSHMKTHVNERSFKCSFCQKGFKRRYDMNYHMRNQHKSHIKGEYSEEEVQAVEMQSEESSETED